MGNINSRVFLSGSPPQASYLLKVAEDLENLGFLVYKAWLPMIPSPAAAVTRWTDLLQCDIMVMFDVTETCVMEAGAAMALGHPVIAINLDRYENDETLWLPSVDHYSTWEEAMYSYFERAETLHVKRRNKRVSL